MASHDHRMQQMQPQHDWQLDELSDVRVSSGGPCNAFPQTWIVVTSGLHAPKGSCRARISYVWQLCIMLVCLSPQVWYKLENLQPSGSFKNRGVGHFCEVLASQPGVSGFAISSGGNAGMGLQLT